MHACTDETVKARHDRQTSTIGMRTTRCPEPYDSAGEESGGDDSVERTDALVGYESREEAAGEVCGEHENEQIRGSRVGEVQDFRAEADDIHEAEVDAEEGEEHAGCGGEIG
ncbi:hypothetical protein BBD39_05610 [Arsenophonus endosymbiont of Bemisia tabaci Asia II 3]|nr:hypothetical protein BBD39_05610 [Arsenophonus endosymbiont of Bemisia tabaci Asia II 3]